MKGMLKENSLKDKVILVTGGGSGLGKSMVKYFLDLGANIIITSRREKLLNDVAKEFNSKYNSEVFPISCDVRNIDQVEKVIDKSFKKFGKIDCLLNNAAGNFISPTERLSTRAFDAVIDIVLKGTINFSLTLGKRWINNKNEGNILNIVTTYSWTGSGYVVPSACAKAGVLSMTRSLAVEWAKYKIRSNAIAPGPFQSNMMAHTLEEYGEQIKSSVPRGRIGIPEDMAGTAIFLCSKASSYITGSIIPVDGGSLIARRHME